jgi:hypothetical protein
MTTCCINGLASLAGGPGARCAPGGEREGQSPLACLGRDQRQWGTGARSPRFKNSDNKVAR